MKAAATLIALCALLPAGDLRAESDPVLARLRPIATGSFRRYAPMIAPSPSVSPNRGLRFAAEIREAALRHAVRPSLLAALVRAESAFDPYAVSSAGALGLGQLMPATARAMGVDDSFDPEQNLDGSARYLSQQLRRFRDTQRALAAYHAGPERARHGLHAVPRVTRQYVARVLRYEREYRVRSLP